ncbi:MAG: TonB family protein [Pseudomonadota bacterium]
MGVALPAPTGDRLTLTVLYALAVHLVLALGLHITPPKPPPPPAASRLEITLVQRPPAAKPPREADYLAEVSQDGGGNRPKPSLPTDVAPGRPQPAAIAPSSRPKPAVAAPAPIERQVLTTAKPARAQVKTAPRPEPVQQTPSAAQLRSGARQYAQLEARLDAQRRAYAKIPREKFITARTREYKYAAYMEAWRRKVEAVGKLNYPAEARQQGLSGSLLLTVRIAPDGHLVDATLRRSSGHPVLDRAAQDIVRWAAPYAPFPPDIRAEADRLVITRTWQFVDGQALAGD